MFCFSKNNKRKCAHSSFLFTAHFAESFQLTYENLHYVFQIFVFINNNIGHRSIPEFWNTTTFLKLFYIFRQNNIGMTTESFHQLRYIDITLKAVRKFEVPGSRKFKRRFHRTECCCKFIKSLNVISFKNIRGNKIHHSPDFCHRIRYRSTGSKYYITAVILLLYPFGL